MNLRSSKVGATPVVREGASSFRAPSSAVIIYRRRRDATGIMNPSPGAFDFIDAESACTGQTKAANQPGAMVIINPIIHSLETAAPFFACARGAFYMRAARRDTHVRQDCASHAGRRRLGPASPNGTYNDTTFKRLRRGMICTIQLFST